MINHIDEDCIDVVYKVDRKLPNEIDKIEFVNDHGITRIIINDICIYEAFASTKNCRIIVDKN